MFIPLRDDNPTSRFPLFTVLLVAANSAVFLAQAFSPEGLQYYILKLGAVPYEITHFTTISSFPRLLPPLTLLASLFVHGSLLHLLGNMLYLWIFGNNVEDYLGSLRFLVFYLLSGLGASLIQIIANPNSQVPMVGASGAISGVLGAYLILYPHARVYTLIFLFFIIRIIQIPAGIILGLWFLIQILNAGSGGGVAWFAHIGGFLAGIILINAFSGKRRRKVWIH